ncbi:mobilization protein [Bacteroidia bacterium]|nr:mobilization protein [Bacteroidia bacterium]
MENKKEKGRPTKGENKLTTSINLKLTQKEFDSVKEKAEILGIKPTQYAREMTINGGVKSRFTLEELDLMRKLAGMANNLNQIARRANQSGFSLVSVEVAYIAVQIRELLNDR